MACPAVRISLQGLHAAHMDCIYNNSRNMDSVGLWTPQGSAFKRLRKVPPD